MEKIQINIAIPFEFYKWVCTNDDCEMSFIIILPSEMENEHVIRGLAVWGNEDNPPCCPWCGLKIKIKNPITETG